MKGNKQQNWTTLVTKVQLRGQAGRIPAAVDEWTELKCYFAQLVFGNKPTQIYDSKGL